MPDFETTVLTALDADGEPFSVRRLPTLDSEAQLVRVPPVPGVVLTEGPASLLCHSHDEELWRLRSFLVRGRLETASDTWIVRPEKFVPGAGVGGRRGAVRAVLAVRRRASRYLATRGLERPQIRWDRVVAAKQRARRA